MSRSERPRSTAISDFRYDEERRELYVRYVGGASYTYYNVPMEDYLGLQEANSLGGFVNRVIKRKYAYTEGAPS